MERIKIRLGEEKSKLSVNTDSYMKIKLEGKEQILPFDDINKVVNSGEVFNDERQTSGFYRIITSVNSNISNTLFNLDDSLFNNIQTMAGFNSYDFLDRSYPKNNDVADFNDITFAQSINLNLKEVNGWFGYMNPDITKKALCQFIDMEPTRNRFSLTPDINSFTNKKTVKNWEVTVTYPFSTDKDHNMVKGGLLLIDKQSVIVSTRNMVGFAVGCPHNLNVGDTVRLTGTVGYNGDFTVVRLGLDNGDLKEYYFVIDSQFSGQIGVDSRFKKVFNGQESEYYFRRFKKIKTRNTAIIENDDYEVYKLGFSKNVYDDPINQITFNEDINVNDLVDNLGRPLTELYVSILKTDSDGLFTNISSGIESPLIDRLKTSNTNTYLRSIPIINMIHNGGNLPFPSHSALEPQLNIGNDEYYGDLVEYNIYDVKETKLIEISHRFNTNNRETAANLSYVNGTGVSPVILNTDLGPRQEGYFYSPHHLIPIRELSNYIEQGDSSTEGIPDYAVDLGDGRYLWRDVLEIGFNDGSETTLDYPFLNGCNYLYQNLSLNLKRQDPFNYWGLYHSKFPADKLGDSITEQFTVNTEDNVC